MRPILVVLGAAVLSPAAVAQAPTVNDQIEKAWKDREEKVRTLDVRVRGSAVWFRGSLTEYLPAERKGQVYPAEDKRTSWVFRLALDGIKVRAEVDGVLWSGEDFRQTRRTYVYDKTGRTRLEVGRRSSPEGLIGPEADYFEVKGQDFRPLLQCVRGFTPALRHLRADDLRPTGARSVVDGRLCEQFMTRLASGGHHEYWLDPGRDWVIVRFASVTPNGGTRLDIRYQPDPVAGWMPKTWEFHHREGGQQICADQYHVEDMAVNAPVAPSDFTITFPVGTVVYDGRKAGQDGETYTVADETTHSPGEPSGARPAWQYAALSVLGAAVLLALTRYLVRRNRSVVTTG